MSKQLVKIANRCPLSLSILRAKFLPLLLASAKNKDKTHREEEKSSIRSKSDVFFSLSSRMRECARLVKTFRAKVLDFSAFFFAFDIKEKIRGGREKASRTGVKSAFSWKRERERERKRAISLFFLFFEICAGAALSTTRSTQKRGEREVGKKQLFGPHKHTHSVKEERERESALYIRRDLRAETYN